MTFGAENDNACHLDGRSDAEVWALEAVEMGNYRNVAVIGGQLAPGAIRHLT